jgi:hypothetical protein
MRIGSRLTPKLVAGEAGTSFGVTALFLVSPLNAPEDSGRSGIPAEHQRREFPYLYRVESVKYWEIIADNLSKAGWSWGCVSAINSNGQTIWIADAHRDDGHRFVVRG